jgi:hypothetical protein
MKNFLDNLTKLLANNIWISFLYGMSIFVLVDLAFDTFIFDNFSYKKIVGSAVFGIFMGWIFHVLAKQKLSKGNS